MKFADQQELCQSATNGFLFLGRNPVFVPPSPLLIVTGNNADNGQGTRNNNMKELGIKPTGFTDYKPRRKPQQQIGSGVMSFWHDPKENRAEIRVVPVVKVARVNMVSEIFDLDELFS